mgnify:CR=1 FL=1
MNQLLGNLALVHEPRPDFEVGLAGHDFYIVSLLDGVVKILVALASLESTVLWIRSAVVPGESDLLAFDERA